MTEKMLPKVLENIVKHVKLIEDLEQMEYAGFTKVAWDVFKVDMLRAGEVSATFLNHLIWTQHKSWGLQT